MGTESARGRGRRPERQPRAVVVYAVSALTLLGAAGIAPVLPVMLRDLSLTEPQTGLVMTAYTLPVVVTVPAVGWLADRVGRRPPLVAGLFLFGVAGALVFFARDLPTILALRALQGVGFSAISPLTITLLGDLFEGDAEAGAQGLRVVAVNLGGFAFPVVAGALAAVAWNLPFLLFLLAIPAGLAVQWWFPEPGPSVEASRRSDVGSGRSASADAPPNREATTEAPGRPGGQADESVWRAVRRPLVAGTLVLGVVRFFLAYGVLTFLPLLVTAGGVGVGSVGVVVGSISGVKVLVASQSRRSFNLGPLGLVMAGAVLASGLVVTTFPAAGSLPAFVGLAGVYGVSEGVIAPLQKSALTQGVGDDVRASVVSLNEVLKNLGKTAAPVAVGLVVADWGLGAGFLAMGLASALVAGVVLVAFARTPHGAPVGTPGP